MSDGKRKTRPRKKAADPRPQPRSGFAGMSPERLREVTSAGGKASQDSGKAHRFTLAESSEGGRLAGPLAAAKPGHMAELGRRGGKARADAFLARCIREGRALVWCYVVVWRDGPLVVGKELYREPPKADDRPGLWPEVVASTRGAKWSSVVHRARHKLVPPQFEEAPWIGTGKPSKGRR